MGIIDKNYTYKETITLFDFKKFCFVILIMIHVSNKKQMKMEVEEICGCNRNGNPIPLAGLAVNVMTPMHVVSRAFA